MPEDWKERLKRIMSERKLDMKELSLRAGLGETWVRDALQRAGGKGGVNVQKLAALADALGMTLGELYEGDEALFQRIPICGYVDAGEDWKVGDGGRIELRLDPGEPIAIEVRGNSMAPIYRNGDLLIGVRHIGEQFDNLIGQDCIIVTADGGRYIKFLARGSIRGRFNLRSFVPGESDIENAKLSWVAPISWIRRGRR